MKQSTFKLNYQIAKAQYYLQQMRYERLKKEGWDVVLPPELFVQVEESFGVQQSGNWNFARLAVDEYAKENQAKRKVLFVVCDTGALSKNTFLNNKGQQLEEYAKDHTTDQTGLYDRHSHFSHVLSSTVGYHPDFPLGLAWSQFDKEQWAWGTGQKVLNNNGSGSFTWIVNGCKEVLNIRKKLPADEWAIVVNFSFGAQGVTEYAPMDAVMKEMIEEGIFICASSGNSGAPQEGQDSRVGYPGNSIYTMAWGAIDENDKLASFSSQGPEVDYVAGGVNIIGCGPEGESLFSARGTSMSSPNGAGATGRIIAANPEIANQNDLRDFLNEKIYDLGEAGKDPLYGHGLPHLPAYDGGDTPPPPPPPAPAPVAYTWEYNGWINVVLRDHLAPGGHLAHRPTGYSIYVEISVEPADIEGGQSESVARAKARGVVAALLNTYNTAWILPANGDDVMEGAGKAIGAHIRTIDFPNVNLMNLALAIKKDLHDKIQTVKEVEEVEAVKLSVGDPEIGDIIA